VRFIKEYIKRARETAPASPDKKTAVEIETIETDIENLEGKLAQRRKRLRSLQEKLAVQRGDVEHDGSDNQDGDAPLVPAAKPHEVPADTTMMLSDYERLKADLALTTERLKDFEQQLGDARATASQVSASATNPLVDEIPAILDRQPLSSDDQSAFDAIKFTVGIGFL